MSNPCSCGRLHADDMDRMAHTLADHIIETECLRAAQDAVAADLADAIVKRRRPRRRPDFPNYYRFLAPYEARFKRSLKSVWDDQRRTVISNLKRTPTGATDSDREDTARFNALFEQWMYPAKPARKRVAAAYRKVATPLMLAQGKRTESELIDIVNSRTPNPRRSIKTQPVSIRWDVYNNMIDTWLDGYMIDLADEIEIESLEALKRALQAGWQGGESISDLVKRVDSVFTEFSRSRSEMIARTESIRASAQGALLTYEASGVVDRSTWIATPTDRTCDICLGLDGKVEKLGDPFPFEDSYGDGSGPPAHPQCVLPGTLCETASNPIAGIRAWYEGYAIKLTFANNLVLSVTPNHMLLTPHGFAAADLLREGDDVFYCPSPIHAGFVVPDDYGNPSPIDEIVGTLAETVGVETTSVPPAPKDLHGDGRFCKGNIDIIRADCLLEDALQSAFGKGQGVKPFGIADVGKADLPGRGDFASMLHRLAFTADRGMGGFRTAHPFFFRRLALEQDGGVMAPAGNYGTLDQAEADRTSFGLEMVGQEFLGSSGKVHAADHGVGQGAAELVSRPSGIIAAAGDSRGDQFLADSLGANSDSFSDLLRRIAAGVETLCLVKIDRFPFHGHVYDLQTLETLYLTNSIVSSNCRCCLVPILEDEQVDEDGNISD